MAMYPCSRCGQRYSGKQATLYFAVLDGTAVAREKYRLCPDCREEFEVFAEGSLHSVNSGVTFELCPWCNETSSHARVFATYYSGRDERVDFWGTPCQLHADRVTEALEKGLLWPWDAPGDVEGPPVKPPGKG